MSNWPIAVVIVIAVIVVWECLPEICKGAKKLVLRARQSRQSSKSSAQ